MKKAILSLLVAAAVVAAFTMTNHQQSQTTVSIKATDRPLESYKEEIQTYNSTDIKVKFLDIKKGTAVLLNDEVTTETADKVISQIAAANQAKPGKPIYLLLDSPGGSVMDGARIISAMQSSHAPVHTICLQLCASMAAMILEYGNQRYAVDRAVIMFHPASISGQYQSELDKVVSRLSFLQRYVNKMDHYTAQRSQQTYEQFKAKSSRELWVDSEDALADKYIDAVVRIEMSTAPAINFGSNKLRQDINLSR